MTRNLAVLESFYRDYCGLIYTVCLKKLKNDSDAHEVVSEVFLEFWQRASLFDVRRGTAKAYLLAITRSRIVDCIRRRMRRNRIVQPGSDFLNLNNIPDRDQAQPMKEVLKREEEINVRNAIDELDERLISILNAFYFEAQTQQQIAARFQIPLGTVKSLIRQAIAKLRSTLLRQNRNEEMLHRTNQSGEV